MMQSSCYQPAGIPPQYPLHGGMYHRGPADLYDPNLKVLHNGPDLLDPYNSCMVSSMSPTARNSALQMAFDCPSYTTTSLSIDGLPSSSTSYYKVAANQSLGLFQNGLNEDEKSIFIETKPSHLIEFTESPMVAPEPNSTTSVDDNHKTENDTIQPDVSLKHDDMQPVSTTETAEAIINSEVKESDNSDQTTPVTDGGKAASDQKPALSYIALIAKSILESPQRRLSLGSIYNWIEKGFPYFKSRGQGWRNSVRHNLSLNDCFIKAGRCEDGKGNYWAIHPANIQDFMRGDFRQRRRNRRRGRKKDCEFSALHNGYLGNQPVPPLSPTMTYNPAASLSSIYSPYTEAERRAYRLDDVLLRQSIGNPFMKWYHNGNNQGYTSNNIPYPSNNNCSPGNVYNTSGTSLGNNQWQTGGSQGFYDNSSTYPLSSSFSRYVK